MSRLVIPASLCHSESVVTRFPTAFLVGRSCDADMPYCPCTKVWGLPNFCSVQLVNPGISLLLLLYYYTIVMEPGIGIFLGM